MADPADGHQARQLMDGHSSRAERRRQHQRQQRRQHGQQRQRRQQRSNQKIGDQGVKRHRTEVQQLQGQGPEESRDGMENAAAMPRQRSGRQP